MGETFRNKEAVLTQLFTLIMFRMMRAVPRMANMRQASIKSQTVRAVNQKVSLTQAARSISTVQATKISTLITLTISTELILAVGRSEKEWVTLQLWILFLIHRLLLLLSELAGGLMISP